MSSESSPPVTIENTLLLDSVPSGSGIAIIGDKIYVIGDDSPYLFQLSNAYTITRQQLLLPQFAGTARIAKPEKPDFESITTAEWRGLPSLLVFGSGSQSPERDSLLVISLSQPEQLQAFALTAFYNAIALQEGISRDDINIEGAVLVGDALWLLNRARNAIISTPWQQLSAFLQQQHHGAAPPAFQIIPMQLPQLEGKQARFSGACTIPGSNKVLFTATVEDTQNWIDDGAILGSFVGLIDPAQLQQQQPEACWPVISADGKTPKDKLESIDVLGRQGDALRALAITDNDNGSSMLIELKIRLED